MQVHCVKAFGALSDIVHKVSSSHVVKHPLFQWLKHGHSKRTLVILQMGL